MWWFQLLQPGIKLTDNVHQRGNLPSMTLTSAIMLLNITYHQRQQSMCPLSQVNIGAFMMILIIKQWLERISWWPKKYKMAAWPTKLTCDVMEDFENNLSASLNFLFRLSVLLLVFLQGRRHIYECENISRWDHGSVQVCSTFHRIYFTEVFTFKQLWRTTEGYIETILWIKLFPQGTLNKKLLQEITSMTLENKLCYTVQYLQIFPTGYDGIIKTRLQSHW